MSKVCVPLYILLAVIIGLIYASTREVLIFTKPGMVTISNLTVNYTVASFVTGGLAGWYSYSKLLKHQKPPIRLVGTLILVLFVAIIWMAVMSVGGYEMRWM